MPSSVSRRLRAWAAVNLRAPVISPRTNSRRRAPGGARSSAVRVAAAVLIVALVLVIVFNIFYARVKPLIEALAVVEAREYVITVINDVVENEITSGDQIYSEFVTLEKNSSGSITALITDMAKVNILQSRISSLVATNIVNQLNAELKIPIGDALGAAFFSWRGPSITARMESVANVATQFVNEFESSGINQTRHRIALTITTDIVILIPGGRTTATVTSTVPIAETVIVGNVPNIYTTPNG